MNLQRKNHSTNPPRRARRARRGMSMLSVAVLGVFVSMWLFAITASVIPMYQRASASRFFTILRSAAEAGLDYAVNELNNSITDGAISSPLDDGQPHAVPPDVSASGTTVVITIANTNPPATSSIYQAQYAPVGNPPTYPNTTSGVSSNGWRMVTATATYAGISKTIRVILEPIYGAATTTGGAPTTKAYFNYAMFGVQSINLSGYASTDGYDSRNGPYSQANSSNIGGDIASNGNPVGGGTAVKSILSGNARVGGSVEVFSQPPGSADYDSVEAEGTVVVNGGVYTNGLADGLDSTNVLGIGEPQGVPIHESITGTSLEVPVVASPSPDASVVSPQITQTGSHYYVAAPQGNQVVNLGSLSVTGNDIYHLPPGDYQVSSLQTSGNGQIVLDSSASNGRVRIFVAGNSSGASAIQITGNGIINNSTKPSNLQIWYGGSKLVKLAGNGALYGVVYAPNSTVEVSGNGAMYGAVVGMVVNATGNGTIHFDQALADTSAQSSAPTYQSTGGLMPYAPLQAMRTISWQEQ